MSKTIKLILFLFFMLPFISISQPNETIAKIEFQLAEEAYERMQYAETREHIKKVEDLLKQQNPKTRYLDIMAHSKMLKLENFTFSNNNLGIQKDLDQLNVFFVSSNDFIKTYSDIVPEEKIKEVYNLNKLVSKSIEVGKNVLQALNKHKRDILEKYANLTIDSNKSNDIQFAKKVAMLASKFRPGTNFVDALYEIDKPSQTGLKNKKLEKITGKGIENNLILPQQNSEQLLSNPFKDFLKTFNQKKFDKFIYPDEGETYTLPSEYQYEKYFYEELPLTYHKVRSTNMSTLKFDKTVELNGIKPDPTIKNIFVDENNIISALYLTFPDKKFENKLQNEIISWMGGMPKIFNFNDTDRPHYYWYLNDLTIIFGYTKRSYFTYTDMYILITHTDKKMSILYEPIDYVFEKEKYSIYLK